MSRLGSLREFDLNHLYLILRGLLCKFFSAEASIIVAAGEVACTNLPDQITTTLMVKFRNSPFPSVVGEVAHLGATVESQYGISTQRTITHCRDVQ